MISRAAALVLACAACDPNVPTPSVSTRTEPTVRPPALRPKAAAPPPAEATDVSALEKRLSGASLEKLERDRKDPGVFAAKVSAGPGLERAELRVALRGAPLEQRKRLAFHRLGNALGLRIVPVSVARRIPVGELAALSRGDAGGMDLLRSQASVANDGTVETLLSTAAPLSLGPPWEPLEGNQTTLGSAPDTFRLPVWATSDMPFPPENRDLIRDYVEAVALDYLAANAMRRSVFFARERRRLVLFECDNVFPARANPNVLRGYLTQLRGFRRFPSALREGLKRLDRPTARALFASGPFEDWLLSPRNLVELDERRLGLLSLIEARIAEHGETVVLRP